jgi:hypothetical protein
MNSPRTHGSLPALLVFLLLSFAGVASAAPIKLGVYYCPTHPCYSTEGGSEGGSLDTYKTQFGSYPAIALNYRNLDLPLLYSSERTALKERGVVPMMTVEPWIGEGEEHASLEEIAAGKWDTDIRSEAKEAIAYGGEVLLRFAHEMNGTWYPWSGEPTLYKGAWKRYVGIFREEGATNVKFVWSPNVNNGSYPFASYFPGDEWVDYVALDGYNWGGSENRSLSQTFASSYKEITELSAKPVIIAETASAEGSAGQKAEWIRTGFLSTIPETMPKVVAAVWFSRDNKETERDWRIETSTESIAAWQEVVDSTRYGASAVYLRPNGDRAGGQWTITGAASASAALDDPVTEIETPSGSDYISATINLTGSKTTEVDLGSTSLEGQTVLSSAVWAYTATANPTNLEVRSGSQMLGKAKFESVGWHTIPIALDSTQAQLDNAYLRFSAGGGLEGSGTRQVNAAFLRVAVVPTSNTLTTRLRPNGDRATESPWTVVGSSTAWDALNDEVTETQTPSSSDYITTSSPFTATEVDVGTTSLAGPAVREASAWFYTPTSSSVTLEVKSGGSVLAKGTFADAGWHSVPFRVDGIQSRLDDLTLRFAGSNLSTRQVNAAFVRLVKQTS